MTARSIQVQNENTAETPMPTPHRSIGGVRPSTLKSSSGIFDLVLNGEHSCFNDIPSQIPLVRHQALPDFPPKEP